jgi:NTP pyrophosphatase (non-canonical NTP hydrolase)
MSDIEHLTKIIREFADDRDWQKFHTPKNLALALSGEVGELAAEFQWLTEDEIQKLSEEQLETIELEIADIAIYLLRLSDVLKLDLPKSILKKIEINQERFPKIK